jgi:GDP-mannose 6-dehydrogenase
MNLTSNDKRNQTRIAVFGLGYVGCVTAACFAELGHRVVGVDIDESKVRVVLERKSPFYEPNLDSFLKSALLEGRLTATTSTPIALHDADFAFLCVGTPSGRNGDLNVGQFRRVVEEIEPHIAELRKPVAVVVRSTVFPGTSDEVLGPLAQKYPHVSVVSNPEFLREGSAVSDFLRPSLLVIGSHDQVAASRVANLYAALPVEATLMSLRAAELIKYACNAFHALKIAFANEIGSLASALQLDGVEIMRTVCLDTNLNISSAYLKPGFAFGGSCLPKDLRALTYRARQLDLDLPLLSSVLPSNEAHISRALSRIMDSGWHRLGIYGLAFKPNTDDLRESPTVALIERLTGKGHEVKIYDPHIHFDKIHGSNRAFALNTVPHIGKFMETSLESVADWAEAMVVTQKLTTEAREILDKRLVEVIDVSRSDSQDVASPNIEISHCSQVAIPMQSGDAPGVARVQELSLQK